MDLNQLLPLIFSLTDLSHERLMLDLNLMSFQSLNWADRRIFVAVARPAFRGVGAQGAEASGRLQMKFKLVVSQVEAFLEWLLPQSFLNAEAKLLPHLLVRALASM